MIPKLPAAVAVLSVLVFLTGCSSSASPKASKKPSSQTDSGAPTGSAKLPRTIVMIEENHSLDQIIGQADLPSFNDFAKQGTLLGQYYAITHPSLPNYIALTSGGTQGIKSDCGRCDVNADNLGAQLQKAKISWKVYAQGLPQACSDSPRTGDYAKKHVPFLYYKSVLNDPAACANVVPFTQFATDAAAGKLPTFVFITPDLAHDMHGVGEGEDNTGKKIERAADAFAGDLVKTLEASPAWKQDTRLVITWDEGGGHQSGPTSCCNGLAMGGHIPTVVLGPQVKPGNDSTQYSHYSLLRSIETLYHLPLLGHAADAGTATIPVLSS